MGKALLPTVRGPSHLHTTIPNHYSPALQAIPQQGASEQKLAICQVRAPISPTLV